MGDNEAQAGINRGVCIAESRKDARGNSRNLKLKLCCSKFPLESLGIARMSLHLESNIQDCL